MQEAKVWPEATSKFLFSTLLDGYQWRNERSSRDWSQPAYHSLVAEAAKTITLVLMRPKHTYPQETFLRVKYHDLHEGRGLAQVSGSCDAGEDMAGGWNRGHRRFFWFSKESRGRDRLMRAWLSKVKSSE